MATHNEQLRVPDRLPLPIDRLPLAYLRYDADLCVLEWNSKAENLFGYQKNEALGRRARPELT